MAVHGAGKLNGLGLIDGGRLDLNELGGKEELQHGGEWCGKGGGGRARGTTDAERASVEAGNKERGARQMEMGATKEGRRRWPVGKAQRDARETR